MRKDTSKSNEFCQYSLYFGFAPRNPSIFGIVRLSNRLSSTVVRRSFDDLRRTTVKWFDGFFDGAPILFTFLHWDATPGHRSVPFGVRSSNFAKRQSNGSKIIEIWRKLSKIIENYRLTANESCADASKSQPACVLTNWYWPAGAWGEWRSRRCRPSGDCRRGASRSSLARSDGQRASRG